jgi:hypothetical protein
MAKRIGKGTTRHLAPLPPLLPLLLLVPLVQLLPRQTSL